jgi:hypothetical protein
MAMSSDEFRANQRVQALKPQVDAAEEAIAGDLTKISATKLEAMMAPVTQSIKYRSQLKSLGKDEGHLARITKEQGFVEKFKTEIARQVREREEHKKKQEQDEAKSGPNLLANSTWGKKL